MTPPITVNPIARFADTSNPQANLVFLGSAAQTASAYAFNKAAAIRVRWHDRYGPDEPAWAIAPASTFEKSKGLPEGFAAESTGDAAKLASEIDGVLSRNTGSSSFVFDAKRLRDALATIIAMNAKTALVDCHVHLSFDSNGAIHITRPLYDRRAGTQIEIHAAIMCCK